MSYVLGALMLLIFALVLCSLVSLWLGHVKRKKEWEAACRDEDYRVFAYKLWSTDRRNRRNKQNGR